MMGGQAETNLIYAHAHYQVATQDYHDAIVDAAANGATQREIAGILGVSYSTVARIVKASGATYVRRAVV